MAVAVAAAVVVNLAVFLVASLLGASMVIDQPAESRIGALLVVIATVLPLVVAGAAVWFLARRWPVVRTVAAWAGLALAVASSVSPLLAAADLPTGLALGAMHVVAGVAWFVGIRGPRRIAS